MTAGGRKEKTTRGVFRQPHGGLVLVGLLAAFAQAPEIAAEALNQAPMTVGEFKAALGEAEPGPGMFLIAEPSLSDPNFRETVVLIILHDPSGTFGIIVNRPTPTPLSRVLPDLEGLSSRSDLLFTGGPVFHELVMVLYLNSTPIPETRPVMDHVYFDRNLNRLAGLLKKGGPGFDFRAYSGHSGWAPGQLHGELNRGSWRLMRADSKHIFHSRPEEVWPDLIRTSSRQWVLRTGRDRSFEAERSR